MKSFFVINYNVNRHAFEPYNIMPHLMREYSREHKKSKDIDFESAKKFILSTSKYVWWSRCEYEIVLSDWPTQKYSEKWDVHEQIEMNIDAITNIFIENIKNGQSRIS